MKLVVFGANGPTGRQVVRQALDAGHSVVAVTRRPKDYPFTAARLEIAAADVTNSGEVADALSGAEAVISTYGVPYTRKTVTVYSEGIANIIAGMGSLSISRLVCVSSTTVATGEAPGESLLWRKALIPVLRNIVGRTLYNDMESMEDIVRTSSIDWTIIRPGGLFNTDKPTADFEVSTQRLAGRMTSRADLARLLILEATQPQHSRSIIEIITRSQLPGPRAFARDAFGIGA
jgi:putative NADH-flavin reductase